MSEYGAVPIKEADERWFVRWRRLDFTAHGERGGRLTEDAARALADRIREGGPDLLKDTQRKYPE